MDEIFHIEAWARDNNLQLNRAKSKEIVITARRQRGKLAQLPPPVLNIERVSSHRILGVIVNDRLTATDHVTNLLTSCSSLLYAMRVLRNHGIPVASLHEVFHAIVLSKVMYCSPAWSGACSVADFSRLDVFLNRCKRYGYCANDYTFNNRTVQRS